MPLPFNNETVVGTCGECSGPVVLPIAWWGVIPPTPTCKNCGATAKPSYGPTLPMNPPGEWSTKIVIDPDSHKRFGLRIDNNTECCVR